MSITEEPAEAADEKAEDDTPVAEGQVPWAGSDRDYTYEEVSFSSGKTTNNEIANSQHT